jgi:hypothetical protein
MITLFLYYLSAAISQQPAFESPVAPNCALRNGPICVLDAGMEISQTRQATGTTIAIYAAHSPEQTAFVSVPNGCRRMGSESPQLAGVSPYVPRGGRVYLELVFKLGRRCFITLSAPSYFDQEDNLLGLSLSLGLIQLCQQRPCSGIKLMEVVPPRLRRSWFSRRPIDSRAIPAIPGSR